MAKKNNADAVTPEPLRDEIAEATGGVVCCDTCGLIRVVDKTLTNSCPSCDGKWTTLDDIDPEKYDADVREHRKRIVQLLGKWELEIPPNVEFQLDRANRAVGPARMSLLMRAHTKAETFYYKKWADNEIDAKKKPMPEEIKALLRKRRRPDPINTDPLMKVTISAVRKADIHGLRQLYFEVYGADAGANLSADNMRRSIEGAIRELIDAKKRKPDADDPGPLPDPQVKAEKVKKEPKQKVPSKAKIPLWQDKAATEEREGKYGWIKKGSWRADPEHDGGTILEIICTVCGSERTIHAADAFQVKMCGNCKKTSKSKGSK